jgi:flagellin
MGAAYLNTCAVSKVHLRRQAARPAARHDKLGRLRPSRSDLGGGPLQTTLKTALLRGGQALSRTQLQLGRSISHVATGQRVHRASDDAAGLAVAVNLESTSVSARQAVRNINDGMSMLQVSESAAGQAVDLLQRMRDLAIQAASETLDDVGRGVLQEEFGQLIFELDRVAGVSEFNGTRLADGSTATAQVQVGTHGDSANRIQLSFMDLTAANLGVDSASVDTVTDALSALSPIDGAVDQVNQSRAELGALWSRLEASLGLAESRSVSFAAAASVIRDTDYATETSRMTRLQMQAKAGVSAYATGLRALATTTSLIGGGSGSSGSGGGGGVPTYEKGDFPADMIP